MDTLTEIPPITIVDIECSYRFGQYENGAPAIEAVSARDQIVSEEMVYEGESVATLTVNMPGLKPAYKCLFIKNYNENEGIAEKLVAAGWGCIMGWMDAGHAIKGVAKFELSHPALIKACYPKK